MIQPDEHHYHTIWTPELVEINLPLAGVARRCIAMVIDQVILSLLILAFWALLIFGGVLFSNSHKALNETEAMWLGFFALSALILLPALSQIIYFWGFHTFNHGQTLGKQWVHIQVVTDRGGTPSGVTHLIRAIFTLLDMLLAYGSISVLMILMTQREKRIADFAAGTVVVLTTDQ